MKKSIKIRLIITIVTALLSISATISAKSSTAFANWYSFNIYPVLQKVFSFISGLFPFSIAEIIVIILALTLVGSIIYGIVSIILIIKGKKQIKEKKPFKTIVLSALSTLSMIISLVAFVFVFNCGINYYRSPFSEYSGLKIEKYSKEQVCEVLEYIIIETNKLANEIELDENGICVLPESYLDDTREAMKGLSEDFPVMNAYYPKAKPVAVLSPLWCYTKIVGIFVPFTMEANFNTCDTPESIGHNICHELSHLTGFMREDEANFVSYIACRESDNAYLRFSGYQAAMNHLLNAYYPEVEYEEYLRVYSIISPVVVKHNVNSNEYWSKFDTPVAEVSDTINDTYLKINNQTDGTKSYGRMVDLVIADYFQNIKEN
ncbi:MAG: DUF3810 domain-containing protein [Ruminiclostridium sp.]|nr:DUF3810 domain-containing protein [Ruminiclostridium sp.]